MKNNYIQNKLVFILGICTVLFGLNTSSALAQRRKPTPAEIQQAKTSLRQQVQSLKSNNSVYSLKDRRTPEQKQNRNKLINAWKSVQPEIAPFLGSWSGYETAWMIYPSNTKGKVCIVRAEQGFINLYFGQIADNKLYIKSDAKTVANHRNSIDRDYVFYQEGNYLGIGQIENNQFRQVNNIPLHSPTTPQKPHLLYDMNLNQLSSASKIVKAFKQAGCTTSVPNNSVAANSQSNTMTWQELKTFAQQKNLAGLNKIIPSQYPNQFADGQVAITMLNNGGFAYVVAREGVNIPNLSSVKELRQTDGSFSAVEIANAVEFPLPALKDTPDSLYNSSQLIEIISWASRYDSEGLRSEAMQSQQTTLPNGQKAYYLKQGNRQGWCTFTDESAQYSDYLCVNIANSPKTSLELLKSILPNNNTASNSSQSTLPSQELVDAIRKSTNNPNYSDVEYSFFEIDLNGDGNKDAIVYETGRHCGQVNCYLNIFLKTKNNYRLLGSESYVLQTFNPKVAILRDSHSGWIDIAMPNFSFNPFEYDKVKGWITYKFNGTEYANVGKSNSINHQTIVDFENAKTFNLSLPGS